MKTKASQAYDMVEGVEDYQEGACWVCGASLTTEAEIVDCLCLFCGIEESESDVFIDPDEESEDDDDDDIELPEWPEEDEEETD